MGEMIELRTLDRTECLTLLAGRCIGRIAIADTAVPSVRPVNYRVVGDEVFFRTGRGELLAAATRNAVVAVETDDIDARTHTGWSVVGVGKAYEVVDRDVLVRLTHALPPPWPSGRASHVVAVPLGVLSGRRLAVADWVCDRLCAEVV